MNSFGQTPHTNGQSTSFTDSGSEAYLYSDPEMGCTGSVLSTSRRDTLGRNKSLLVRTRGDETNKTRLGAAAFSDNYEWAGMAQEEGVTGAVGGNGLGHLRSASMSGVISATSDRGLEATATEVIAAPKQPSSAMEKQRNL
ncbi:hypothetical protein FBUS_03223 [Fasciolopsis buskii]|uniref:Uncharacterized protein n=1 Tax=Fasciolopsis buskii TaxID=27845 RepID=A0A8E0VFB2_9TREM|nr:hypothetical protein FBUS_03223 [Fasciolopsis buski]